MIGLEVYTLYIVQTVCSTQYPTKMCLELCLKLNQQNRQGEVAQESLH